ncbi:uncharacterized protein N7458_007137 [Penicillium daleae]|uniref:Synaptobrevin n=1 Tax=Penicillium daleae TaxID=63821 RepID=A0AAD6G384_9EURO|nr:uncharacterized protein N7458_007137 [Penicillium daleae]KAJ5450688.1 hypothetical protein N7458_007137 [Penicillium daleae]
MAVTAFPSTEESPDLTLLNVARLFTRLEHNLLSPGSELRTLRKSELQRLRVAKNVDYARTLLSQLERSLPQIKPLDRRHEAQAEIARDRQLLKRMQSVLDEEESRAEEDNDGEVDEVDDEWKELFSKPITGEPPALPVTEESAATTASTTTSTSTSTPSSTAPTIPPSTLRNRNPTSNKPQPTPSPSTTQATSTSTNLSTSPSQPPTTTEKEAALTTSRLEQEDLTTSLLSLATQLKASSHSFQATLENEKSVLDRAVSGIDKTSSTMEAAGQRMGMLRRMTEGKGWWGRMMLYGWIFGLWVVAVLIVYVGPKLRF